MMKSRSSVAGLLMVSLLGGALMLSGCSSASKRSAKAAAQNAAPNLGVNAYLWRASLETLDFMPMDSADPFGGTIITSWYANPEASDERFKANVYILDNNLRADALKVSVFKQVRGGGGWTDAATDADTSRQIENSILTRARELYIATEDGR